MEIILDNVTVGLLSRLNEPIGDTKSIRLRREKQRLKQKIKLKYIT